MCETRRCLNAPLEAGWFMSMASGHSSSSKWYSGRSAEGGTWPSGVVTWRERQHSFYKFWEIKGHCVCQYDAEKNIRRWRCARKRYEQESETEYSEGAKKGGEGDALEFRIS